MNNRLPRLVLIILLSVYSLTLTVLLNGYKALDKICYAINLVIVKIRSSIALNE